MQNVLALVCLFQEINPLILNRKSINYKFGNVCQNNKIIAVSESATQIK